MGTGASVEEEINRSTWAMDNYCFLGENGKFGK